MMFTRTGARRGARARDDGARKFAVDIPEMWRRPEKVSEETLLGAKKPLKTLIVMTWFGCLGLFALQCWYYLSLTDDVFAIQSASELEGYTCTPLVLDGTYALNITYAECMATYYEAPTKENVFNINADKEFIETVGDPGPWEFGTGGLDFPSTMPVYYHKPFPTLSRVAFSYHPSCALPLYKGFENADGYSSEFSSNNPLKVSYEASLANGANSFAGYGKYAIANDMIASSVVPESMSTTDWLTFKFKASSESDAYMCPSVPTSVVTDALVAEAKATGALVFPRVHSAETDVPIPNLGPGESIAFKPRSVGLTVMYPPGVMQSSGKASPHAGQDLTISGSERCDQYESQMAADAFSYIYTYCHPCDDFANNAPFICLTTKSKNEVLEVISLAVGNTLACMDFLIIAIALVLILAPEQLVGAPKVTTDPTACPADAADVADAPDASTTSKHRSTPASRPSTTSTTVNAV